MPAISPTTLLLTGSISITLSPAALVWTIRTVAARAVRTASGSISSSTESLVFIREHSKLPGHVADPLFRSLDPGSSGPGPHGVAAQFRPLQDHGGAPLSREAPWSRPLRRVSLDR